MKAFIAFGRKCCEKKKINQKQRAQKPIKIVFDILTLLLIYCLKTSTNLCRISKKRFKLDAKNVQLLYTISVELVKPFDFLTKDIKAFFDLANEFTSCHVMLMRFCLVKNTF